MRILIVSKYAWDDRLAGGNTLSNFFCGWTNAEFYNIYCRDAQPNNKCCSEYFAISPINIFKNLFLPWRIGHRFTIDEKTIAYVSSSTKAEESLTRLSKKSSVFAYLYDILYSTRFWLNNKLIDFIDDANPDIVFCFGVSDAYNYQLIRYLRKRRKKHIVTYFLDDHYYTDLHWWNIHKKVRNIRLTRLAQMSDKRYGITQMMCDAYSDIMKVGFEVLTKGCYVNGIISKNNNPIKMLYAGNLLYNRDKTIIELVAAIEEINHSSGVKCHLDIYTTTQLDEDIKKRLNVEGVSSLNPPRPYEEIQMIMSGSDIVLHVESFDKEQIEYVHYSFSTKITDCLQSGAMVLAIGPDSIASIEYLKKIPGVVVVTDLRSLSAIISNCVNNVQTISRNAIQTYEYARLELSIDKVRNRLQKDFTELTQKEISI